MSGLGRGLAQRAENEREERLIAERRQHDDVMQLREEALVRAREIRQDMMRQQERATDRQFTTERDASQREFQLEREQREAEREERLSPPKTREVKRADDIVTQEWNAAARQWRDVATSPRYDERADSYQSFLVPLARKLAGGGELTSGEQSAVNLLQRTSQLDQLIGGALRWSGAEPSGRPSPSIAPGATDEGQLLQDARDAIQQGADPGAVSQRLRELGLDPADLDSGNARRSPPASAGGSVRGVIDRTRQGASPAATTGRFEESTDEGAIWKEFDDAEAAPATGKKPKGSGTQADPYTPATQEDFDAVPAGAVFRNPADQRLYRKK